MNRAQQLLAWNVLISLAWIAVLILAKMDHGKGSAFFGLLAVLIAFFAMAAGIASGVGALILWREITWIGRGFSFLMLIPSLVGLAKKMGWF